MPAPMPGETSSPIRRSVSGDSLKRRSQSSANPPAFGFQDELSGIYNPRPDAEDDEPWAASGDGMTYSASHRNALTNRTWLQTFLASIVCNPYFDLLIGFVVLVQIGLVVLETDARASGESIPPAVPAVQYLFTCFYAGEVAARLYVWQRRFFLSSINILDILVVLTDVLVDCLGAVIGKVPSLSILRVLRILRVARVLRTARTFRFFRELYMIIHGFVSAMKAIVWATLLLFLILTLWGIIAVEIIQPLNVEMAETGAYGDCERCARAFESVEQAALTFVQQIVAGDSWGLITLPIIEAYPATVLYFVPVLISVELGLMNLILSVIVDKAQQAHEADRQFQLHQRQEEFKEAKKNLFRICHDLDVDKSGNLTLREIEEGFDDNMEFYEQMRTMDVHKEDLGSLFKILDDDASGEVNYKEFVEQLHKMKTMDAQVMLVFIRSAIKDIRASLTEQLRKVADETKQNRQNSITHENQNSQILAVLREVHQYCVPPGTVAAAAFNIERVSGSPRMTNPPEPTDSKAAESSTRETPPLEEKASAPQERGPAWMALQSQMITNAMNEQLHRLQEQIRGLDASVQLTMQSAFHDRGMIAPIGTSSNNRPLAFAPATRPGPQEPLRRTRPSKSADCGFPVCCGPAERAVPVQYYQQQGGPAPDRAQLYQQQGGPAPDTS